MVEMNSKFCSQSTPHIRDWGLFSQFRFIDLFAGIGGIRLGMENSGGRCVFTSEWDKYSQITYKANFCSDHSVSGDIRKIDLSSIPSHDVLCAGFPCQPFSIAGVSKKNSLGRSHGFADEKQGNLFFRVSDIIAHHRPAAFLLENVKNLISHDKGNTFKVILNALRNDHGYHVFWKILDSRSWVPQKRERIFIVGFRSSVDFNFDALTIPDPDQGPRLGSILDSSNKVNSKYILSSHMWDYLQNYKKKHQAKGNGFGFGICGRKDVTRTLSARYYKDGSEILIRRGNANPRRLTPRECSRLMGFPKDWKIPVSDTQAYRQFGNSVVVPAVSAVVNHMLPNVLSVMESSAK